MIPVDLPVRGFLPVAHVLFPEQVVAVMIIIRGGHIERATRVLAVINSHLDVDLAELRVGDGGRGVERRFTEVPAVILLRFARPDPRHIWTGVDGDLAVVGATVDQAGDASPEPFEEGI